MASARRGPHGPVRGGDCRTLGRAGGLLLAPGHAGAEIRIPMARAACPDFAFDDIRVDRKAGRFIRLSGDGWTQTERAKGSKRPYRVYGRTNYTGNRVQGVRHYRARVTAFGTRTAIRLTIHAKTVDKAQLAVIISGVRDRKMQRRVNTNKSSTITYWVNPGVFEGFVHIFEPFRNYPYYGVLIEWDCRHG